MKSFLLFLFYVLITKLSFSQTYIWPQAANRTDTTNEFDTLNNRQNIYQDLLKYHDPILYVAPFPHFSPLKKRQVDLRNGEGKNGYWLEGNLTHRIILYRGKYYSNAFLQRLRVTFDIGILLRMTRDDSSPLLPHNNDVGIGADYLLSPMNTIERLDKPKLWIKAQVHHYSNGQSNPFYLDPVIKRNNYINGDFSTNYFQVFLQAVKKSTNQKLLSAGLGYQREINIGGPLILSDELTHSFGRNRLLLNLQYVRQPKYEFISRDNNISRFRVQRQLANRSEFNFIVDKNLSRYPGKKFRIGWHNYLSYMPWVTNEVGFLLHTYFGRDYLNIRFDDIIAAVQLGLIVKLHYR